MTKLLEQAFSEAAKLPTEQQEALAALILEEMASETKWDELFARSQDKLAQMAQEALKEYRDGKTRPFEDDRDLKDD